MEIGAWMEKKRPYSCACFGKSCGMRSTVLLDTSKSSWEREVMNALNKGKALTGFLTFLDMRGSSTRVTAVGNQPSVVPLLTDLLSEVGTHLILPGATELMREKMKKKIKVL